MRDLEEEEAAEANAIEPNICSLADDSYHSIFLDASSHLYMRVCPSVRLSVHRLVMLLSETGKLMIMIANNDVSCNQIIIQSFHHHEDASFALLN